MWILKWSFWGLFWLCLAAFLHYTLPQTDVVRITDTYEKRVDFDDINPMFWAQEDHGSGTNPLNRDVLFIQAIQDDGDPMVYRNEDTGWGWPPYFKFDTANLQAEAADQRSTADNPRWVAVRHYGWRIPFYSIFPNAISVWPVEGPDALIIPWVSIIVWVLVIMVIWFITARWIRFKWRAISPTLDSIDASLDEKRAGFSRWLNTWRSKPRG